MYQVVTLNSVREPRRARSAARGATRRGARRGSTPRRASANPARSTVHAPPQTRRAGPGLNTLPPFRGGGPALRCAGRRGEIRLPLTLHPFPPPLHYSGHEPHCGLPSRPRCSSSARVVGSLAPLLGWLGVTEEIVITEPAPRIRSGSGGGRVSLKMLLATKQTSTNLAAVSMYRSKN